MFGRTGQADAVCSGHRRQAAPKPFRTCCASVPAYYKPGCTPSQIWDVVAECLCQPSGKLPGLDSAIRRAFKAGAEPPLRVLPAVECLRLPACFSLACYLLASAVMEQLWSLLLQSARGFLNQVTASFTRRRTVEPSGSPGKPASPSSITLLGGESPVGGTAAGEAGEVGLLGATWGLI